MHVLSKEGLVKTKDGMILFQQSWSSPHDHKGAVVLLHGYGEHSGRYQWFARQLVLGGYVVHTFDQRSHGKSEGLRAFIPDYDLMLDDLDSFLEQLELPSEQVCLYGHGFGADLALNYAAERGREFRGLILSAPIFNHARKNNFTRRLLSRVAAIMFPKMGILDFLYRRNPRDLSRRQYAVDQYLSDPFVYHGKIFNRTGWELFKSIERSRANISKVEQPLFILHGDDDRLADPGGSRDLHRLAPARYKALKVYPDAFHDLLQDACREQVVRDVLSWLDKRS